MQRAKTSKPTVWRWQTRYLDEGVAGLLGDKTRPSRVPPLPQETRLTVIAKTVRGAPPNATHWSRSMMAEAVGISPSSVGRIWAAAGLKPHVSRGFKVSNNPLFEEKVTEIVGLIWTRRTAPPCCVLMRNHRSRHLIGPSLACRSRRGAPPR